MNTKIGVVTVTYNSADVLDDFLESIQKQTHGNFILYIIDNDSNDDTANIIDNFHDDRVVYIQNDDNVGVAAANNQGILKALEEGCDFILLLNNDTLFDKNTFEKLLKGLQDNHADIVIPKMYYYDKKDYIWCAGGNFDEIFKCDVDHIGFKEKDIGQHDEIKQVTYAPTCCMLFSKQLIDDVGLMDEKYFVYEDDVDFCYRATILKKKKMLYLPDFKFYHKVGGLTNKEKTLFLSDFSIQYMTRNKVYRCKKFFSFGTPIYLLKFFIAGNLKILMGKVYKRSFHSTRLFYTSFFKGLFY